jgi:hypothetical protein
LEPSNDLVEYNHPFFFRIKSLEFLLFRDQGTDFLPEGIIRDFGHVPQQTPEPISLFSGLFRRRIPPRLVDQIVENTFEEIVGDNRCSWVARHELLEFVVFRGIGDFVAFIFEHVKDIISLEAEFGFERVDEVPKEFEGRGSCLADGIEEALVVFDKREDLFPLCALDDNSLANEFLQ